MVRSLGGRCWWWVWGVLVLFGGSAAAEGPVWRLLVEADAAGRDRLSAMGYDIAGHDLERDRVEVITDERGLRRLVERGFHLVLIEHRPAPRPLEQGSGGRADLDGPLPDDRYHDPAEVQAFLETVAADHPAITRLVSLGQSVEGRTLWGLMISDNADRDEDELAILFNAAHHAREVMTPEVVMDTIDQLTDNYGTDPRITSMVDTYQIWCVPMVNPDGVARVHEVDDNWRKNLRDNDGNGAIDSQDGVDLNRNYQWGWGGQCRGSSSLFASATYRGPRELSEPESQALIEWGRTWRPVFDVEYHAYGEDVFYALSCDPSLSPTLSTIPGGDPSISRVIAEDYAARLVQADGGQGFSAAPYGSRVDGTGRDNQYRENGSIAFVTEVNNAAEGGFRPDYGTYRDATVQGQRPGWKWLIERMGGPAVGGHVTDALTGRPLEAEISLDEMNLPDGRQPTSRADTGRFHLIVVPGDYTLRVRAPGYAEAVIPVTVADAPYVPLGVALEPAGANVLAREDFEDPATALAWTSGFPGDTATDGRWQWGEPQGTHDGDAVFGDLEFGAPRFDGTPGRGVNAWVTGNQAAAGFTSDDVDGGVTSLVSPSYDLSGWYGVRVGWRRWFRKDAADPVDRFDLEVSTDGGASWLLLDSLRTTSATADAAPAWTRTEVLLDAVAQPGADTRFRFRVADDGAENVVEGAIDDFLLLGFDLQGQGEVSGVRLVDTVETVVEWDAVPGGEGAVYDVVRGDVASLGADASGVDLGPLLCIEDDSVDTSTADHPDGDSPSAGAGFFYLVRFELGLSRGGWGSGSGGGTRSGSGGCP
ncbi:MAG: M14 family zinc carboxypeptidase [Acidobacteriota bacterium]|nr:M14 family zinc carboxypeptidase [Acidobacteriota bacterium]